MLLDETNDILSSINALCKNENSIFKSIFSKYLKLTIINESDSQDLLNTLSDLLFCTKYTKIIVKYFSKYVLQFLSIEITLNDDKAQTLNYNAHLKNCIVLSILAEFHPDAKSFMLKYFEKYPSPFDKSYFKNVENFGTPAKRRKIEVEDETIFTDFNVVNTCYTFLKVSSDFFRLKWNWSTFIEKYFNNEDTIVKWICCQCIAILTGMNEHQLNSLLAKNLPLEDIHKCTIEYDSIISKQPFELNLIKSENSKRVINLSTSNNVISVAGILLSIYKYNNQTETKSLVQVESTQSNLRKVALGISSNKAICLQGPVGSSKTTLVEYLATVTGRKIGESFIKVQLGDQTDSKMLLGTYRCTDIPGEFVWQLGVLTQAVTEGCWLLLEDIDSASMDIATVIISLLENGYLTVPGYRDMVPIKPGFQLFVTQRLFSGITGYYKKNSNVSTLLEKHMMTVNIEPLSPQELIHIIKEKYPSLSTIASRMVDVFLLFAEGHDNGVIIPNTGRLMSTRDLFKWCLRAIIDFDISSPNSALKVLQDAIDTFCCSLPKPEDRLRLSKEICSRLGIIETKAEYFCNNYKPNVSLTTSNLQSGRGLIIRDTDSIHQKLITKFSFTRPSSCLLERIICCVNLKEPVLLVGETGTGKTSSVQYLASVIGQKLIVINMNQQSDSADLLGGYKPVDLKYLITPIKLEFELLFRAFFSLQHNQKFLQHVATCYNQQKWSTLVVIMKHSQTAAIKRLQKDLSPDQKFLERWTELGIKLNKLTVQLKQQNALAFAFIEGSLVKAIENGFWVLLDEINLATAETLECLSGLLEGTNRSLSLLERGDRKPVERHENFTLFACMNPSTDVGKKDLPAGLRNRFTEFFVEELTDKNDLLLLVGTYLKDVAMKQSKIENIVKFYLTIRKEAQATLSDGSGHAPHYSLRTLCRALTISTKNNCGTVDRNLYEAFCLSFLTQLDSVSYKIVEQLIVKMIVGKEVKSILNQPIPEPRSDRAKKYVNFEGYWVSQGSLLPEVPKEYILTESVRRNLKDLVRVVSIGKLPVLLQGDTSVGKTSLITYLAKSSGNKCVRINNHEHTDLQEYIGSYIADTDGKLVFREGVLVEAMRKGHWIILDELNLAPTDVLEALNRVLDDNRELFIPETQETVKAHPNFMLFATQNPPGAYGGRKMLSRAFRNRFVELHFNEIPPYELETILHRRCEIPPSYCKKMIAVMIDLQTRRRGSAAFAGKQGFITLRDLFRWGERYRLAPNIDKLYDWDQHIADEGYLVLAGRVRKPKERSEIIEVLSKHIKRIVNPQNLFSLHENTSPVTKKILQKIYDKKHLYKNIVWTFNTRQLAVLVSKALEFIEPVLLVGETGGGKTTICQLIAENNGQKLITVNCHMHTESSDFIGGLRPVRDHSDKKKNKLFEWVDGPLIQAMQNGEVFLADEISLADDSVLERLNSLLEPERTLLLAEKGNDLLNSQGSESIKAHNNFFFIGTMNPGGDFGKKELSPALRNRFTEIWCEACTDRNDLIEIIEQNLKLGLSFGNQEDCTSGIGRSIMDFIDWFKLTEIGKRFTISIRDILTWVNFINATYDKVEIGEAYLHGACLTFLDSFGSGVTGSENRESLKKLRDDCTAFLIRQVIQNGHKPISVDFKALNMEETDANFGIKPFLIEKGNQDIEKENFVFNAPTTIFNTLRLLRGLQLNKAILLEGSPGVGKTSLVNALAKATNNKLLRVNLSDQTDICDLFGADLPVEGGQGGEFAWRDGPFLQALKNGDWIVLDELNLASQSVLEGLNACLDHRGEIFIPELGKTFYVKPGTKLFACQNPLRQGGSRRGLPKSFLNRFTQVYVETLSDNDLSIILEKQFPLIPNEIKNKMIEFNKEIVSQTEKYIFGYKGAPWEFNLRDLTRWCEILTYDYQLNGKIRPEATVQLIYGDRMRTNLDKQKVYEIFENVFKTEITGQNIVPYVTSDSVHMGDVKLSNNVNNINLSILKQDISCLLLRSQFEILRSLIYCINLNWMAILVGSGACGKSSIIKTLSQLSGNELRTFSVNSAMDTMDILGGFEQVDYNRHLENISEKVERILLKTVQKTVLKDKNVKNSTILFEQWEAYKNFCKEQTEGSYTMADATKHFEKRLRKLKGVIKVLSEHPNALQKEMLDELAVKLDFLRQNVEKEGTLNAGGKFEWVDSVLIKCLQDGCWLLIDNVNLCSPAVLDRLNALLEPNGILTIGERGVDLSGEMITIKPHPNFRLFLTMDSKNGEISRAMRNRGVEIYILNETEKENRNELDVKGLIAQNGITEENFQNTLLQIHDTISENVLGEKPSVSHILQVSFLISQQILRGLNLYETVCSTIIDVYVKSRSAKDYKFNDPATEIKDMIVTKLKTNITGKKSVGNELRTLKTMNLQQNCNLELIKQQTVLLTEDFEKILLSYNITSGKNLYLRYLYIKQNYSYEHLNHELYTKLEHNLKSISCSELPVDGRWIHSDIISIEKTANQIFLLLYFTALKVTQLKNVDETEMAEKKYNKFSILQYSREVSKKNISHLSISEPLIINYFSFLTEFDNFLLNLLENVDLNLLNEETINSIITLNWRVALQKYGETIIYNKKEHVDIEEILSNLVVKYKWFLKNTVTFFKKYDENKCKALSKCMAIINESISSSLSVFKKIAKRYRKGTIRPLPYTNEKEIESAQKFLAVTRKVALETKNSRNFKINVSLALKPEIRTRIIQMKNEDSKDFDVELDEDEVEKGIELTHVQLLPVNDIVILYVISSFRNNFIYKTFPDTEAVKMVSKSTSVPYDLSSILEEKSSNELALYYGLSSSITSYLMHAIALNPSKYLHFDQVEQENFTETNLLLHTPALSYNLSQICIDFESKNFVVTVNLGSFKSKREQFRYLNELLWQNGSNLTLEKFDLITNDIKYIIRSFKNFIDTFITSQNITNGKILGKKIDACIEKINDSYLYNRDSPLLMGYKENFVQFLNDCKNELKELTITKDEMKQTLHVANMFCLHNYCQALLNSQLEVIDPLQKNILKKKYCGEERQICERLKNSFVELNEVYSGNPKTLHCFTHILNAKISSCKQMEDKYGKLVAVRPKNQNYSNLFKDVSHSVSTLLSEDFFILIFNNLNRDIKEIMLAIEENSKVDLNVYNKTLNQTKNWINSQENMLEKISKYRIGYPDIIEPILSNITELSYGIRLLYSTLHKLIEQYEFVGYNLPDFMSNLVKFPFTKNLGSINCVKLCTENKTKKLLTKLLKDSDVPNLEREEINRLFKSGLQELYNVFVISAPNYVTPSNELVQQLNTLINTFVLTWNRQEDEKRRKLEEENQLYKMKTKCETLTDEQQANKEMKELFQNFHEKDFSDFQLQTLDSDLQNDQEVLENDLGQITEEDVQFVCDLHSELTLFITKTKWLNLKRNKLEPDFVTPFLQRFKTFALLMEKKVNTLSYKMDKNLVHSLNLLVSICESYGEGDNKYAINSTDSLSKHKNSFDFYHDSKIDEVKTCVDILNSLNQRISELLSEWPNHPTLISIKTVIERIYSFSITSPIARFLTGIEILLTKCHEWEENAHVGVSLAEYSEKITLQIISWRKLELSYWKDSLNKVHERVKKSVTKWWFHLYLSIQEFVEDKSEQSTVQKVIEILKHFIESSSLGEFEDRLKLLFVFHCHVVHLPKTSKSDMIISILWNLHCYYNQFLTNVHTKIKELRTPIEKKLKDFVKIARWNDINYWSVKETVEKTHRTLHKHIKEFETALKESVKICLVHSAQGLEKTENVGIWDRPQRHTPSKHHYTILPSNYLSNFKYKNSFEETKNEGPLLDRTEKYFAKSRNLCKEIISLTKYPSLIKNVDSFVTEVIETSTNLKNLEVNTGLPKSKQKSQAKSFLQQKRKALSDLFKTLTTLGISYRTGLLESKLRENSCSELLLSPIDLRASFDQIKVKSASTLQLLNIWDGCETYFLRTISRLAALQVALKQPAPDLGMQNIERCKGFAAHLTILGENQKQKLIDTSRDQFYLKHFATNLSEFNHESTCLKSSTVDQLYELAINVQVVMKQYEILLQSCPEQPNFASDQNEIPLLDSSVQNFIKYKYEPNWVNTLSELKLITQAAQKIKTYLDKHQNMLPNLEEVLKRPQAVWFTDISTIKTNLETMSKKIKTIESNFGNPEVTESLSYILEKIEMLEDIGIDESPRVNDDTITNFRNKVEKLIENILLVVQNLFKKYREQSKDNPERDNQKEQTETKENDNDIDEDFIDNHLRVAVIQNLFEDLSSLQINKVLSNVFDVLNDLNAMNSPEAKVSLKILSNALPLLEQIVLMYEYFITQQVASYRVTCKLNSILLNIFTELATNGFCVPPELSDEMGPEGQMKQQNGMGLGDGEGERDVSDRIENEDQLDDAQPAGQEKKKEEDKDCKEEDKGIEMSEDFDSKLQDVNQPEDDDDQSNSDNEDADKQMGETDPNSDKLDEQIWGSDHEENEEEDESKESKEEKGDGGEVEDQKMAAKEDNSNKNEEEENDPSSKEKKKEQEKDINEMNEPEIDDDQIDPYHGKHPQMPEPEDLDLPDDLQLDDGEEKEEAPEENPFDIDTMKEQMPNIQEEPDPENNEKPETEEKKLEDDSNDEEEGDQLQENNQNQVDNDQPDNTENPEQEEESQEPSNDIKKTDEKVEDENNEQSKEEESGLDPEASAEDQIQPMDIDNIDNSDNVQTNPNQNNNQQSDQVSQEENLDKDGVGQSQMEESDTGHKGQANANKQSSNKQKEIDDKQKRQRPGEADSNRSLGETSEPVKKKLKSVNIQDKDKQEEGDEDEGAEEGKDADMYQHIKEAKETDTQVLDAATKEQAETQKIQDIDDEKEENIDELNDVEMATDEPEPEISDVPNQKSEKTDKPDNKKPDKNKQNDGKNGEIVEEIKDVEIEGDIIETMNVERGTDSTYHTQYDIASEKIVARLSSSQIVDLRNELENQLASWNEPPPSVEAEKTWEKFSAVTSSLARDLSEQLRLVLEPTQASRLRGDFKTGRRINMRKVIPYIASQFRKDKIWLRRTKPSKREYQIVLAIDDSSSMDDNHSKELAFESVALISKALSLLESGELSILSFGEHTEILHKLSDTFTEKSGVKLLQKFTFQQKKTCVANLVDFVTNMFSNVHTTAFNAKLLVIVSDGRGIFSEGETVIQQAIRSAKFADIFMVFVILDNPENKNSILDIRMPVFKDGKLLSIKSYLDSFPFPFYIILRDINNLPNVLSDALRQWFELVTNKDN